MPNRTSTKPRMVRAIAFTVFAVTAPMNAASRAANTAYPTGTSPCWS